jgi:hypothetical protein
VLVDGHPFKCRRETSTGTVSIPFENRGEIQLEIVGYPQGRTGPRTSLSHRAGNCIARKAPVMA